MAAVFRPQTAAELQAALASRCNLVLDPIAKQMCLAAANAGVVPPPPKPASIIPRWVIGFGFTMAAYALWKAVR